MSTTSAYFEHDLEAFMSHFMVKGIPESVVKQVYQFLRKEMAMPKKESLSFSDNIYFKFGIVDDDLERLTEDLAALLNRRLPRATLEQSDKPMIYTIEDLILFVWFCPSRNLSEVNNV